jgi:hypothetical protein
MSGLVQSIPYIIEPTITLIELLIHHLVVIAGFEDLGAGSDRSSDGIRVNHTKSIEEGGNV